MTLLLHCKLLLLLLLLQIRLRTLSMLLLLLPSLFLLLPLHPVLLPISLLLLRPFPFRRHFLFVTVLPIAALRRDRPARPLRNMILLRRDRRWGPRASRLVLVVVEVRIALMEAARAGVGIPCPRSRARSGKGVRRARFGGVRRERPTGGSVREGVRGVVAAVGIGEREGRCVVVVKGGTGRAGFEAEKVGVAGVADAADVSEVVGGAANKRGGSVRRTRREGEGGEGPVAAENVTANPTCVDEGGSAPAAR